MKNNLNKEREDLIAGSIQFVLEHGWCENALSMGSVFLKQDPQYWGVLFASLDEAVEFFERSEDQRMINEVQKFGEVEGVRNKISKALLERIVSISGGVPMLKRLEGFYCRRALSAFRNIWNTADIIWLFVGDRDTDFNYYSKRTLLSGVYVAVVKRVLRYGNDDIQQYIANALNKVGQFGRVKRCFKILKIEDIPILRMFL